LLPEHHASRRSLAGLGMTFRFSTFRKGPLMDLRKIKKLIDLLDESNLAEIEIKEGRSGALA
jgi:hypothetical protein